MGLDVLAAENSHICVVHFDPGVMDTSMQDLIRAQPAKHMPQVEVFRDYHRKDILNKPQAVASDILLVIESHFSI